MLQYENIWGGYGFVFHCPHCYSLCLGYFNERLQHLAEELENVSEQLLLQTNSWNKSEDKQGVDWHLSVTGKEHTLHLFLKHQFHQSRSFQRYFQISCHCVTKSKCLHWNIQIKMVSVWKGNAHSHSMRSLWLRKTVLFSMFVHWHWQIFGFPTHAGIYCGLCYWLKAI